MSFLQGDPILIEGGTSIGKTTTVKKMCADLGWEVHYANLNGASDVEDFMGRYIPNPDKRKPDDPEYVFADGKVTSGLRQEEGKTKVIILDELNASAPNILIRLHEVLDALERGGDVVLSEDASESISVDKQKTKIVALMNPPGKGFQQRETMDPAQLRRWVYQKEATDLPEATLKHTTAAMFGLAPKLADDLTERPLLPSNESAIPEEQLAEIPGLPELLAKYIEFHKAAKEMVAKRKLGQDQPQPFTYDDRMEPHRVRNFVQNFYRGDINKTFQDALRYYYAGKVLAPEDRESLENLIRLVEYTPPAAPSKRRGLETAKKEQPQSRKETPEKEKEKSGEKKTLLLGVAGIDVESDGRTEYGGFKVGDELRLKPDSSARRRVKEAKRITVVGFTSTDEVFLQLDGNLVVTSRNPNEYFEKVTGPKPAEAVAEKKIFLDLDGDPITADGRTEVGGYKVGDKLTHKDEMSRRSRARMVAEAKDLTIVGFSGNNAFVQVDGGKVFQRTVDTIAESYRKVETAKPTGKSEPVAGKRYIGMGGAEIIAGTLTKLGNFKVGDRLVIRESKRPASPSLSNAKDVVLVGITEGKKGIVQIDGGRVLTMRVRDMDEFFEQPRPESTPGKEAPGRDPEKFLNEFFAFARKSGWKEDDSWNWQLSPDQKFVDMEITTDAFPPSFLDKRGVNRSTLDGRGHWSSFMGRDKLAELLRGHDIRTFITTGDDFFLEIL